MDEECTPLGQGPRSNQAWKIDTRVLPDDADLPGLMAIKTLGLARAIPALDLPEGPVELINRGYTEGSRITLEARAGQRRFAVKSYAGDPSDEAALYEHLASAGLTTASGCCAPPLLLWERPLRVLVIGWLEGPSAEDLLLSGQGARAGELAAMWLQRIARLPIQAGPAYVPEPILSGKQRGIAALAGGDSALGVSAVALADKLDRSRPKPRFSRLVHGTFYTRHIFDLGNGPGVIDWQRFCQGPLELDAGIFLATVWRARMRPTKPEAEVERSERSFLAGTEGLLDERTLAWHRSAMLLRLATKLAHRKKEGDWSARSSALLTEAARFVVAGGGTPIHV